MSIKPAAICWSAVLLALIIGAGRQIYAQVTTNLAGAAIARSILSGEAVTPDLLGDLARLSARASGTGISLHSGTLRLLGIAHLKSSDQERGLSLLERSADLGDPLAHFNLSEWYVDQGNWKLAAGHLHHAQPDRNQLVNRTLDRLIEQQQPQDALALAEEYTAIHPDASQTYYRMANLFWNRGDREGTINALSNALTYDPEKDADAYRYQSARLAYLQADFGKAALLLETLLFQQPDNFAALVLAGQVSIARDDPAAAQEYLTSAIALNPGHLWSHVYLALAYLEQGMLDKAAHEYRQASLLAADPGQFLDALAGIYARMRADCRYTEIKELLRQNEAGEKPDLEVEFQRVDQLCTP